MTSYKVQWKQSAKKELKKLDRQTIRRILQAVEKLANNPYVPGCKKLVGSKSIYRIRGATYLIVYDLRRNI